MSSEKKAVAETRATPVSLLDTPDHVLLRLNKLLATPGGLSAFLSTFNYTLYILTYLDAKSGPLKARLSALLSTPAPTTSLTAAAALPATALPSPFAAAAVLISQTRTTLRLFGLLPLYAWARNLARGPATGQDTVLYVTAVLQCALYIVYQALENLGFLADKSVIPAATTVRLTRGRGSGPLHLWSCRIWLAAIGCDYVRLWREAVLERHARRFRTFSEKAEPEVEKRDAAVDRAWWRGVVVAAGWTPVAVQYCKVGGVWKGWNLGIMGLSGGSAGLGRTLDLWAATK